MCDVVVVVCVEVPLEELLRFCLGWRTTTATRYRLYGLWITETAFFAKTEIDNDKTYEAKVKASRIQKRFDGPESML